MIVSCSSCLKRYLIDETMIYAQGRIVRCVACDHTWTQFPEKNDVKIASPHITHSPIKKHRYYFLFFILLLFTTVGMILYDANHLLRRCPRLEQLCDKWGIKLQDPAHGLLVENVIPLQIKKNQQNLIILRGEIINTTNEVKTLPLLSLTTLGTCSKLNFFEKIWIQFNQSSIKDSCTIDKRYYIFAQRRLLPGERLGFETPFYPYASQAHEISISF